MAGTLLTKQLAGAFEVWGQDIAGPMVGRSHGLPRCLKMSQNSPVPRN